MSRRAPGAGAAAVGSDLHFKLQFGLGLFHFTGTTVIDYSVFPAKRHFYVLSNFPEHFSYFSALSLHKLPSILC